MGYRSEVAYTIRFVDDRVDDTSGMPNVKESFYLFLAEAKANELTSRALNDESIEIDTDRLQINFYAQELKWYPSYEGVKAHEALCQMAVEWAEDVEEKTHKHNPYIGHVFVRIGEDTSDIEEACVGTGDWDWVRSSRQIITDWN
jgi:hypothetical protein